MSILPSTFAHLDWIAQENGSFSLPSILVGKYVNTQLVELANLTGE